MARKRTCSWCGPGDQSGPNNGFYYLCEECYDEWDYYMHIGRLAVEELKLTHPGAYRSRMENMIRSHSDLFRRFGNLKTIQTALDKGDMGPMVEALPKEFAMKHYPEHFDEAGNCKSNVLARKAGGDRR
jgi:hypothetical protein